ncbi:MAG: glycoside hydrolase family 3 protein, partial [Streptosporangiaceae bacterium]
MPTANQGRIPPGRAPGRAGAQTNTAPASTDTDLSDLVAKLTLHEKVLLLTGADSWSTQGADLLGLRPMVMSDGPAGARGVTLDERHPSTSLPCPSALGATWDPELVHDLAAALGAEARAKGIDVLLGPTINMMRSPVGGRGFECFAEDPVLTARIAASYVRGLQGAGVAATLKHFVCNDSETQRWSYDARVADHVLRELYLVPFEACIKEADAALVMAAYNMVNGTPMTENARMLKGLLKGEWAFGGVVTSDWHAARSTTATALATLDLSMPGPDGPWGERLAQAVADGIVTADVLDDKIVRLLGLARRVGALDAVGEGAPPQQVISDDHEAQADVLRIIDPALLRRATAASFVLLRNENNVLPLRARSVSRLAVLGPGALRPTIQGG